MTRNPSLRTVDAAIIQLAKHPKTTKARTDTRKRGLMCVRAWLQVAAGMGDAVTEGELAALVSTVSDVAASRGEGENDRSSRELNFDEFVRLFLDVF